MDFRVPDTLNSGEPLATDDSVDVEFAEFTDSLAADASPVEAARVAVSAGGTDTAEIEAAETDAAESVCQAALPESAVSAEPPAWFRSIRKIQVNDAGAQFRLTIKTGEETANVSGVLTKTLTFNKPDGSTLSRDARFYTDGSDGIIAYTTVAGDLDAEGEWTVQAFVDFGESPFESEIHSFTVHKPAQKPPPVPAKPPKRLSRREALKEERRRRRQAAIDLGLEDPDPDEEPPKNWREWLWRWLTGKESRSLVTSLAFHFLLLICLSLIALSQVGENQSISMFMGEENSHVTFEELDVPIEISGGEQEEAPQLKKIERESAESVLQSQLDEMLKLPGDGGSGGGVGSDFAFKMPSTGQVVKKGSFSAWTVPKDPRPGQDYKIVIQIQVPETITRYRVSDLTGRVIGTDKYTLDIPYEIQFNRYGTRIQKTRTSDLDFVRKGDFARVVDGQVQVVVNVEGAKQLVQDTIEVKSRMLKEEQKLEIVF